MATRSKQKNIIFLNKHVNKREFLNSVLKKIFGIGKYISKNICYKLGFLPYIKLKNLKKNQIKKIQFLTKEVYPNFIFIETKLQRYIKNKIFFQKSIKSWKGFRHLCNLPVNGQRSRTNAKTQKNKKTIW